MKKVLLLLSSVALLSLVSCGGEADKKDAAQTKAQTQCTKECPKDSTACQKECTKDSTKCCEAKADSTCCKK